MIASAPPSNLGKFVSDHALPPRYADVVRNTRGCLTFILGLLVVGMATGLVMGWWWLSLGAIALAGFLVYASLDAYPNGAGDKSIGGPRWTLRAMQHRGERVQLHRDGLIVTTPALETAYRWESVRAIHYDPADRGSWHKPEGFSFYIQRAQRLHLEFDDGRSFALSEFLQDVEELAECVQAAVYQQQLNQLQQDYDKGQRLAFGAVTVSTEGFEVRGQALRWRALEEVSVYRRQLCWRRQEDTPAVKLSLDAMPNFPVLLELIERKHPYLPACQFDFDLAEHATS